MSLRSVVHEYDVLYSTRVFQKEKRWSDGRLKYYEFNRKMEVYSDNNVFVATDFYPHSSKNPISSGAFSDGFSYKFQSGSLLVEFVDYIGRSEREVTIRREPVKKEFPEAKEFETHDGKREVKVKKEPGTPVSVKQELQHLLAPPKVASQARPGKSVGKARKVGLSRVKAEPLETILLKFDKRIQQNTLRIPPGSNRWSIWHKELENDNKPAD